MVGCQVRTIRFLGKRYEIHSLFAIMLILKEPIFAAAILTFRIEASSFKASIIKKIIIISELVSQKVSERVGEFFVCRANFRYNYNLMCSGKENGAIGFN